MLSVSELVEAVSTAIGETGKPLPTVRMIARRMIDDEVLPKAVGARIPRVGHEEAASLLLAVMATPAVNASGRTALTFGALVHLGIGNQTAREAVGNLLRRLPKDPLALEWSMEVCKNFPQVVLKQKPMRSQMVSSSERTDYGDVYIPQGEDWAHWPSDDLKEIAVLSGVRLLYLANILAGE